MTNPPTEEATRARERAPEGRDAPRGRDDGRRYRGSVDARASAFVRRGLPLLCLVIFLLGAELATGMVGEGLQRIGKVASALLKGEPTGVDLPVYATGIVAMVVGAGGLVASVWSRLQRDRVVVGRDCPVCGARTKRIHRRFRHRLAAVLLGERLQRRICRECGWKGLARIR